MEPSNQAIAEGGTVTFTLTIWPDEWTSAPNNYFQLFRERVNQFNIHGSSGAAISGENVVGIVCTNDEFNILTELLDESDFDIQITTGAGGHGDVVTITLNNLQEGQSAMYNFRLVTGSKPGSENPAVGQVQCGNQPSAQNCGDPLNLTVVSDDMWNVSVITTDGSLSIDDIVYVDPQQPLVNLDAEETRSFGCRVNHGHTIPHLEAYWQNPNDSERVELNMDNWYLRRGYPSWGYSNGDVILHNESFYLTTNRYSFLDCEGIKFDVWNFVCKISMEGFREGFPWEMQSAARVQVTQPEGVEWQCEDDDISFAPTKKHSFGSMVAVVVLVFTSMF